MKQVSLAFLLLLSFIVSAQGGSAGLGSDLQGGGGFGGGGFGGFTQGGQGDRTVSGRIREIEEQVNELLLVKPVTMIVTPGEYGEWKLDFKKGQVVYADAVSTAFDPALEVTTEPKGKNRTVRVLATSDDRYPGDQRPLLLWRCPADGKYALRVRCFRDKSGGQVQVRMNTFQSYDIINGQAEIGSLQDIGKDNAKRQEDAAVQSPMTTVLLRVSLTKGEIVYPQLHRIKEDRDAEGSLKGTLFSTGLPDVKLGMRIVRYNPPIVAPVSGDYYQVVNIRPSDEYLATIEKIPVLDIGQPLKSGLSRTIGLWKVRAKKGDVFKCTLAGASSAMLLTVSETPDFDQFDLNDDAKNPFYPSNWRNVVVDDEQHFLFLRARNWDERVRNIAAIEDVDLWLSSGPVWTKGRSSEAVGVSASIAPAINGALSSERTESRLRIGDNEYWSFEGQAGDVVTFYGSTSDFVQELTVLDLQYQRLGYSLLGLDETRQTMTKVLTSSGRHLLTVSGFGDGGGGPYSVFYKVVPASACDQNHPAIADETGNAASAFKITVLPDNPVLLHWQSEINRYPSEITDDKGRPLKVIFQQGSANNWYAVVSVEEKTTFLFVVRQGKYKMTVTDLPRST